MEHVITETIYNNLKFENSPDVVLEIQILLKRLSTSMEEEEYNQTEESLCSIFTKLEKDGFHAGFNEGIRFILRCV